MPKCNSNVQNQIQWQDINLLQILLKISVCTIWWVLIVVRCCYISALVLSCFRLKKDRATFFRPETIVASFLHSMLLLPKVFSLCIQSFFENASLWCFIVTRQKTILRLQIQSNIFLFICMIGLNLTISAAEAILLLKIF